MVAPAGLARSSVVELRVVGVTVGASLTAVTVVSTVLLTAVQAPVLAVPPLAGLVMSYLVPLVLPVTEVEMLTLSSAR